MANTSKYCLYCGKKLPRIASFCIECGEKQREVEEDNLDFERDEVFVETMPFNATSEMHSLDISVAEKSYSSQKKHDGEASLGHSSLKSRVVANAFFVLLAAILVFSATFLPMIHLGIVDRGDIYVSLDFSVWDYIVFLSDSRQNVSVEEGDTSPLLKEYLEIQKNLEKFKDEEPEAFEQKKIHEDYMSKELADTIRKLIVLTMRMQYQDINTELSVSFYLAGIASIVYFCFAIVFLAIAIPNCFYALLKGTSSKLDRWSIGFLCATPMMLLVSFYAMFLLHGIGYGKASLSTVATIVLACLFLCIVYVVALEIKKNHKRLSKRIIGRLVCAVLSVMVIFSLFLPTISICAENETKQATLEIDIGCFNVFSQIEGKYKHYANMRVMELIEILENKAEHLLQKSSRALKNIDGDLDEFGENMIGVFAGNSSLMRFRTFFSFVPAFTLLVACLAGCVFVKCIFSLSKCDETKKERRRIVWSCILLLISTIVVLALIIITVAAFDFVANFSKAISCDVIIGVSAIVNVALSIIILCIPKPTLLIEGKEGKTT